VTDAVPEARRGLRAAGALFLWGLLATVPAPALATEPPVAPAAPADRKWEGLVRRRDGLLLWGRWRTGTLTLREETLRWADGKDPGRNLVIPVARITSHRRICRDPLHTATCFEWSLRTKDGERYVFRSGRQGGAVGEVFTVIVEITPTTAHETAAGTP
jgi:hypothetical protein